MKTRSNRVYEGRLSYTPIAAASSASRPEESPVPWGGVAPGADGAVAGRRVLRSPGRLRPRVRGPAARSAARWADARRSEGRRRAATPDPCPANAGRGVSNWGRDHAPGATPLYNHGASFRSFEKGLPGGPWCHRSSS